MYTIIKSNIKKFSLLTIFIVAGQLLLIYAATINALVLNELIAMNLERFLKLSIYQMIVWCGIIFLDWVVKNYQVEVIQEFNLEIRNRVATDISNSTYQEFHSKSSGTYLSWLNNDVQTLNDQAFKQLFLVIKGISGTIFAVVTLNHYHWSLTVATLFSLMIMLLVPKIFASKMREVSLNLTNQNEAFLKSSETILNGFDVLASLNLLYVLPKKIKEAGILLKNWDSMLRESILRVYSEAGEANITLSSGFDSNYILYILANYTNSSINAFCIGGEKGINEIPEVTKIAKFYGINLLVDTIMSQDLEYFPDIVWRLEGSLFECGVILQYYLGRLLFQKGNTSILCGESADEIMTFKYHSVNYNQFCNDKQKSVYFSYSDYPFYVTNSIVLKKNSLLLHSFGIHPRYPYKMSEIVEMSKKISDLNDKKEFHKKNCELRFQDSVLDNINSVPGTTHLFSCLNIQTLVKIILYIFRYNSCMKIFNFRDKELIFFNKIVNGLIQNIEENLEDDIERILKYLYICLFNEIFIIKNKVNFF